jgi:predicted HTH transcriptional regulator
LRKLDKSSSGNDYKGQNASYIKDINKRQSEASTDIKDKNTVHSVLLQHTDTKDAVAKQQLASSFQMKKQSRREQILALFVKGVDVSIKDIAVRIRGCSEKTIQRELNSLLEDNIIKRIGEKRWSRYILV